MNITDVRIRKVNDEGKMKAVVSITFDDEFVVHDIKIIEGQNGLFIAMPSRKMKGTSETSLIHWFPRQETRSEMRSLQNTRKSLHRKQQKVKPSQNNNRIAKEPS